MNILFIHASNIVAPAASGIIRVTATLKRIFEEKGHKCYNAYYKDVADGGNPVFDQSLKLTRDTEEKLLARACDEWSIDAIICQLHPSNESVHLLQSIRSCTMLRKRPLVIQCMHNNPYIEVLGYTPEYMHYLLSESHFSLPIRLKKVLWGMFCCYMPVAARKKVAARYQRLFDLTDKVVLLSDKFMPEMRQYQCFRDGQLQFANNPMTYDASFSATDLETKEKLVIYVGRLDESQKRLSVSLKLWKRIEEDPRFADWRFDIVGSGDDADYYQRIARKLKLERVRFCGMQRPHEWYRKASILMLTSAYEGWGMVINEAQQRGVIPVAYDSYASVHDLITDGMDGFVVPNLDSKAYVDTLKKIMLDADMRKTIQINGLNNSGRFSEEVIYQQWERILKS